ncbi:NAD(P)-dependent oxidoreductase [Streptomyces axinellae]|uniref:NAD-dependent epimerase/dehydratase family protein n=1 Tax=Streptomyces axinellae TaxID=552788 RepID=A0ABN3QQH8_9ACTN
MRVLITGATGYVGQSVATALAAEGHHVSALTRDPDSGRARTLAGSGVRLVQGSLTDRAVIAETLTETDAVVHTAYDPADQVGGERALFAALAEADRRPHVVYTSGCSVYGEHAHARLTSATPVDGGSVRAGLEAGLRDTGVPHTVLRPGMVHGGDARSSIVGAWFRDALTTGPVHRGRRDKVWSWIHVDDLARAYAAVLRAPEDHRDRVYLLADSQPASASAVVEAAARAAGSTAPVTLRPIEDENPLYRVFDRDEVVDSSPARAELGWAPRESGVIEALPASFAAWRTVGAPWISSPHAMPSDAAGG